VNDVTHWAARIRAGALVTEVVGVRMAARMMIDSQGCGPSAAARSARSTARGSASGPNRPAQSGTRVVCGAAASHRYRLQVMVGKLDPALFEMFARTDGSRWTTMS